MSVPHYHLDSIFDPQAAHYFDAHSRLMRLIPKQSRVLELGCASGYLSGYMQDKLGCDVVGLEYDAPSVAVAQTRCAHVFQTDLESADGLEQARAFGPYDVVLAAAVLEHLKSAQQVLRQAVEMLSPDGFVIVSLPNIAFWRIRLSLLAGRFDYAEYGIMDRTHVHFYTLQTGRDFVESAGLHVEDVQIAGSGLQNLADGLARRRNRDHAPLILPSLFAYELIYVARRRR